MKTTTMRVSMAVLAAAAGLLCGCQHVGSSWEQDAVKTDDKSASNARAGMIDKNGNWSASGPQMAGSTSIDAKGISRNNGGSADSLFYWDGKSLAIASNADLEVSKSKFYTPEGKLVAEIGTLTRGMSEPTRASNEALDRVAAIVATITPAQVEALKAQAALGDSVAGKMLQVVAMFATGGAAAAVP